MSHHSKISPLHLYRPLYVLGTWVRLSTLEFLDWPLQNWPCEFSFRPKSHEKTLISFLFLLTCDEKIFYWALEIKNFLTSFIAVPRSSRKSRAKIFKSFLLVFKTSGGNENWIHRANVKNQNHLTSNRAGRVFIDFLSWSLNKVLSLFKIQLWRFFPASFEHLFLIPDQQNSLSSVKYFLFFYEKSKFATEKTILATWFWYFLAVLQMIDKLKWNSRSKIFSWLLSLWYSRWFAMCKLLKIVYRCYLRPQSTRKTYQNNILRELFKQSKQ